MAAGFASLVHWGGAPLEDVLTPLALFCSLPVAWFVAFHGRVRVTRDRVFVRGTGSPLEKSFAVRRGDRVCLEPTPSFGSIAWSVALQTSRDARDVMCGRTSYDEARRVAHAICRTTTCPLQGVPGQQPRESMPPQEIGQLFLERCRTREQQDAGSPGRRIPHTTSAPKGHGSGALPPVVRPVGLAVGSTPEGGTVYSWRFLPWHVLLARVTGPALCSYLAAVVGMGAGMLHEGFAGRTILLTAVVVHALLGAVVGLVVVSSARLVVTRRWMLHQVLVAGLPLARQKVVTTRIEEMGSLEGLVVISDDGSSLLFRMGHDPELSQGNAQWLLEQLGRSVKTVQEDAEAGRG